MRKRSILILLVLQLSSLPAGIAFAVPAAPEIHTLQQPDGGVFTARQWGDERHAGWETEDGFTVLFDAELDAWTFAESDGHGNLISSGRRADRELPPARLDKRLRPQSRPGKERPAPPLLRRNAAPSTATSDTQAPAGAALPAGAPPAQETGYLPVILVNFSDTTPTYTTQNFSDLLFGTGTWSMKDYYEEVSSGRFTVSPGPAGVVGWVTASNTHDYYGRQTGPNVVDTWPGDLVFEAVQQADATVDFSAYDLNGDCYCDTVAIVHQGTGQEASGKSSDIWSHSWSLAGAQYWGESHYGPYTTNDTCRTNPGRKVVVNNYIIQPEKFGSGISTMGVFAHEYGHALGLPDLYDTDGSSEGVGNWSLMASGSWSGVSRGGDRPSHLDPWSKYVLGWITPVKLATPSLARPIAAVETGGEVLQFLDGSPATGIGEYFLLENRHRTGFDYALPGFGLMLWHIDESRADNNSEWYPGCTGCTGHYQVAVVPADNLYQLEKGTNRGDGGDPFPGTANRQAISSSSSPNNNLYSGAASGFSISSISPAGAVMTADITPPDTTPPVTTITVAPPLFASSGTGSFSFSANESATFACRLDGSAWNACSSPYPFAGLADGSHTFSVRATDLSANQETAPPAYSWTIDTSPPETTITATPANPAVTGSGSFAFSANETGATFACSLDSGNWTLCSSPYGFSGLADGSHSFSVRAIDPAANVDPTPATYTWVVSTAVPPNVKLSATGQADSYFGTIGASLTALPTGVVSSLRTQQLTFAESLDLTRCEEVVMSGSYAPGFTSATGPTIVQGSVTISCGTMIVEGLAII
jgi:M6 family metalloprotease-like protein